MSGEKRLLPIAGRSYKREEMYLICSKFGNYAVAVLITIENVQQIVYGINDVEGEGLNKQILLPDPSQTCYVSIISIRS